MRVWRERILGISGRSNVVSLLLSILRCVVAGSAGCVEVRAPGSAPPPHLTHIKATCHVFPAGTSVHECVCVVKLAIASLSLIYAHVKTFFFFQSGRVKTFFGAFTMTEWRIRGGKSDSVHLLHFMFVLESQDESAVAGGFPPLPRK